MIRASAPLNKQTQVGARERRLDAVRSSTVPCGREALRGNAPSCTINRLQIEVDWSASPGIYRRRNEQNAHYACLLGAKALASSEGCRTPVPDISMHGDTSNETTYTNGTRVREALHAQERCSQAAHA